MLLCSLAFGGELDRAPKRRGRSKLWWASVVALVLASGLDARSSWGRPEMNPLLRGSDGRFGGRSVAIKSALVGAACGVQSYLLGRHSQSQKPLAATNAAVAGWFTAAAVRNHRQRPPR